MLATTVVVCGDEEFLRARRRDEALAAFRAEAGEVSVTRLVGDTVTETDAHQALMPDLFADTTAVVISDAQKMTDKVVGVLTDWCADPGSEALLILDVKGKDAAAKKVTAAFKTAGATVHEVSAPKGADRRRFTAGELRRAGVQADSAAEQMLVDCEPDLRGIALRADQLATDLGLRPGQRGRVTVEQMATVVSSTGSVSGFAVADALAARDAKGLVAALDAAQAAGTATVLIVSACLGALRDIAAIRSGKTGKMPPWKVQKAQRNARKWSPDALARAIAEIAGAHPAIGTSGRRDSDLAAVLVRAVLYTG